jgi:hypothetical protein
LTWLDHARNEVGLEIFNGATIRVRGPGIFIGKPVVYDWTGLAPNTYMCFRVRAFNGFGFSDYTPNKSPYYKCATTPGNSGIG